MNIAAQNDDAQLILLVVVLHGEQLVQDEIRLARVFFRPPGVLDVVADVAQRLVEFGLQTPTPFRKVGQQRHKLHDIRPPAERKILNDSEHPLEIRRPE